MPISGPAKGCGFLSFAKNVCEKNCKNISKTLSGKYSQKRFGYAKKYATETIKNYSKRIIQNTAEATGNLTDNKLLIKLKGF